MSDYSDIINHKAHVSSRHPRMSIEDRAAQFSPFAALSGYEETIEEAGRVAEMKTILGEDAINELNTNIGNLKKGDYVSISYFIEKEDIIRHADSVISAIDTVMNMLLLEDGKKIPFDSITSIEKKEIPR